MDEEEKRPKQEDETPKKTSEEESNSHQDEKQTDHRSNEAKKKELEKLLKEMKKIEQKQKKKSPKGPKMVKIEFGSIFHPNPFVNFLMYYLLNLVVIYSLFEVFSFVEYPDDLITILLFVVAYTMFETVFRQYLVFNHFKFVLRTFGFIFFFGYLSIFYLLDSYLFTTIAFVNETLLIIFVGMFIVFRYLLAQMVKQLLFKMKG
ncbi:MAG: hypothetical protein ACOC14_02730 [Bacillota bacterium]